MYDTNQLEAQGGMPKAAVNTPSGQKYIQYFGRGMRNSTFSLKKGDGIFLSSCLDHTGGLHVGGNTKINGTLSSKVLGDWFYGRLNPNYILRDTCDASHNNLPCNPSCAHGPAPGPTPSGNCSNALESHCPTSEYSTPYRCGQCAKKHRSELVKAGCTVAAVTAQCKARISW